MENSTDRLCSVIANSTSSKEIEDILSPYYKLKVTQKFNFYPTVQVHHEQIDCIIVSIGKNDFEMITPSLQLTKTHFPALPVIIIFRDIDLELVRMCGQIGIDRVMDRGNIYSLKNTVSALIQQHVVSVKSADFGIDYSSYPIVINRAIHYIEKNYLSLMGSKEIADYSQVSDCTLSRVFRQHNLLGPKRLLMLFKIRHAVYLMKDLKMSIKDIAFLSGFSNEKRFNDCFHRVFDGSPKKLRMELINDELSPETWQVILKRVL